jgi:hypothetical protein
MISLCRFLAARLRSLHGQGGYSYALPALVTGVLIVLSAAFVLTTTNARAAGTTGPSSTSTGSASSTTTTIATTPTPKSDPKCWMADVPPSGGTAPPPGNYSVPVCQWRWAQGPTAMIAVSRIGNTDRYALNDGQTQASPAGYIAHLAWTINGRFYSSAERPKVLLSPGERALIRLTVWQTGGLRSSASMSVQVPERVLAPVSHTTKRSVTISAGIFIDNTLDLGTPSQRLLTRLRSEVLAGHNVRIAGYGDNWGAPGAVWDSYSDWLTKMQALAVADFIYGDHIPAQVKIFGYGRADFYATNTRWQGRADNQRVIITFSTR